MDIQLVYVPTVFCVGRSKNATVHTLYAIKCQLVVIELWLGNYRTMVYSYKGVKWL